ncbi:MAG: hypothetical protein K2W85_13665 [Phycisphaerales bacterium]|nr:hypothetical protein [Phycisphaerales bacterium]
MRYSAIALVGALGLAGVAQAQTLSSFVLNDGLFRYSESNILGSSVRTGSLPGGRPFDFGFAGVGNSVTQDYGFENWFYYRSAGDSREFALSNQTLGIQLSPNSVFLRYEEAIGGSATANGTLRFELTYTLNQISATQAAATINWGVTNNSQTTQDLSFFSYCDYDIGSFSDDQGLYTSLPGVDEIRTNATSSNNALFATLSADLRLASNWQIGTTGFSDALGLRDLITTNFTNGTNNNLADVSGGYQFRLGGLAPGASVGGRVTKGYNYAIPAPGAAALLGLGGLLVGRRRR